VSTRAKGSIELVDEFFEVRTQVDLDLTTVNRVDRRLGLIKNLGRHNQMDVKSAFLNGKISELVYVEQPSGFEDHTKPNHVYKLSKALYGLKQAPCAWYERLRDFLLSKGF
jgi:hypothetical protein